MGFQFHNYLKANMLVHISFCPPRSSRERLDDLQFRNCLENSQIDDPVWLNIHIPLHQEAKNLLVKKC